MIHTIDRINYKYEEVLRDDLKLIVGICSILILFEWIMKLSCWKDDLILVWRRLMSMTIIDRLLFSSSVCILRTNGLTLGDFSFLSLTLGKCRLSVFVGNESVTPPLIVISISITNAQFCSHKFDLYQLFDFVIFFLVHCYLFSFRYF